jgi:hypothetical protein
MLLSEKELPSSKILSRDVKIFHLAFFLAAIIILGGCRQERQSVPSHAFYYWKHQYKTTAYEDSEITDLDIRKIYVKFFDVTLSESGPVPVAVTSFDSASIRTDMEYVPVIFITQAVILQTENKMLYTLAKEIVNQTLGMAGRRIHLTEIQLDCDWAEHSRDKYFILVDLIRKLVASRNIITSCTIRLHQVKYKEASGIPPCDRGMLMFYNMSDWRNAETKNSIFDPEVAEKYINYIKDYPLKLDVALPIFHWAIGYRDESFLAIFDGLASDRLKANTIFAEEGARYKVLRDTFAFGAGLHAGDIIRPESCDAKTIAGFSSRILSLLPDEERSFALYHLDSATLSQYSHEDLQSLFPH